MDVALLVRVIQRIKRLGDDGNRILIRKTSAVFLGEFGSVSSFNKLCDQVDDAVVSTAIYKLDYVSMFQRRGHIDFPYEPSHRLITDGELRQQSLYCHCASGSLVTSQHHAAHTAATEQFHCVVARYGLRRTFQLHTTVFTQKCESFIR